MKDEIHELSQLCKKASELERKWDRTGRDYLQTRIASAEYRETVSEYLEAVRRLELALTRHFVAVTAAAANGGNGKHEQPEDGPVKPVS